MKRAPVRLVKWPPAVTAVFWFSCFWRRRFPFVSFVPNSESGDLDVFNTCDTWVQSIVYARWWDTCPRQVFVLRHKQGVCALNGRESYKIETSPAGSDARCTRKHLLKVHSAGDVVKITPAQI